MLFAPALGSLSVLLAVPAGIGFAWANVRLTRSLHVLDVQQLPELMRIQTEALKQVHLAT